MNTPVYISTIDIQLSFTSYPPHELDNAIEGVVNAIPGIEAMQDMQQGLVATVDYASWVEHGEDQYNAWFIDSIATIDAMCKLYDSAMKSRLP